MAGKNIKFGNRHGMAAVLLAIGTASPAMAQQAYFSFQGNFATTGDKEDFGINLSRSVGSGETLKFQTFSRNGGTNAAGEGIPANASGIDSVFELFDSGNFSRGFNDDQVTSSVFDSLLTWTQVNGTALNPNPLASGNYRLNLIEFGNNAIGPWTTDLVGPADAMTLSSVTPTGTATISSLTFGTTGVGANTANFNVASGTMTNAGTTTIKSGGLLNITGGTYNANNNVVLNGGKLLHTSGAFNLAAGKNLTASNSAQVSFTGGFSLANGGTVTIQSGSSISATDFVGAGFFGNGSLVVTGLGSSLSAAGTPSVNSSYGFNGFSGSLTVSDQAIATYNSNTLRFAFDNNPASTGTLIVNTQGKLNSNNISAATGSAGTGTITVNGSGSAITQAGASTLTLGGAGASTSVGTINIQSAGSFTTGTGAIAIQKTGTVNIAGGTFNANGDITLDGGKLLHTSGTFNLAAGKNLTASNGAQVGFTGGYIFENGSTFTIQSGSSLSATDYFAVGLNSTGTLVVTGLGSTFSSNTGAASFVPGIGPSTANMTVADQATATFNAGVDFGIGSPGNCTVNITTGGHVVYGQKPNADDDMHLGGATAAGASVITVNGSGSSLTGLGATTALIGGLTSTTTGTINLQSSGVYSTGTGTTTIQKTGTLNIAGGTFNANGDVTIDGGKLLHTSGTLNFAAGKNLTASNAAQVSYTGSFYVQNGGVFTIQSGSTLSATNDIGVARASGGGTLIVTGPGSSLNTNTVASTGNDIGLFGFSATVTIADQATANFGGAFLGLARSSTPGSMGTLNVTTGAQLTSNFLQLGSIAGGPGAGVVNVNGAGSKITLNGAFGMALGTGSVACSVNIQNGGTLQTGTGLTTIGPNGKIDNAGGTFTAAAVQNDGLFNSAATTSVGAVTGIGTTTVSGGTFNASLGVRQNAINLTSGGAMTIALSGGATGVSYTKALTITGTSKLELHDNDLIVDYTGGSTVYTSILDKVKLGLPLLGFGGTGKGITSAEVIAQGAGGVGLNGTMLGVIDGSTTGGQVTSLSGFTVANPTTSVLVKYTWRGDTNLDGVVNGSDYALADTGFSGGGTGWFYGDVNYDGTINGSDYALIDTGFSSQTGPLPEPAMLGLLGVGAGALLRRRRMA
ncbi:MAG: PEP-CTERM sorting domain-containing protein [Burkholderiales bacterium]|nr:PEP-CTERM sorting domain-containing protein [Phycisphaerae bacterium]